MYKKIFKTLEEAAMEASGEVDSRKNRNEWWNKYRRSSVNE